MADNRGKNDDTTDPGEQQESTPSTPDRAADPGPIDREHIARRAYERYRARGGEHGRDLEDWLEAERHARQRTSE